MEGYASIHTLPHMNPTLRIGTSDDDVAVYRVHAPLLRLQRNQEQKMRQEEMKNTENKANVIYCSPICTAHVFIF
jgi:hypothetical protein